MIQSMTGFGKAVEVINNKKVTAEIKSLNSKQLDLSVKLPPCYRELEMPLRSTIAHDLMRGKIDLMVTCEPIEGSVNTHIDGTSLQQYRTQIEALAAELSLPQPTDWWATLLRLPEVVKNDSRSAEADEEELAQVAGLVARATEALVAFRTQEGNRLQGFFEEKINAIGELLAEVPKYEAPRVETVRSRIVEELSKLENVDYDKNRLEQELIFYIEKFDITEEKTRLANHLRYFMETMEGEPVGQGKKLGFISQEIGREVNTMGSKANEAELQKLVVRMKDHLEQIKEQVLNVL